MDSPSMTSETTSPSMMDRLRDWYEYEKDSNQKVLTMLQSVPEERQQDKLFQKAIDKFTHAVFCRKLWIYRFGLIDLPPASLFPEGMGIDQIPDLLKDVYSKWDSLMTEFTNERIAETIEYKSTEGPDHSDMIESILVHLHGHMMYHRGQIATLVSMCDGTAIDTDYFYWIHRSETPTNE